ncbi:hypothetical protein D0Z00_002795 [Geotrichum galactomycetum]|uniref:Uncharacterized protein n=1 Tax=Geotrichum galactomycetum TaxID=27317 RepID=A0ACB6V354_9ASCO|nr:hypothetical protein D0Z00_002795 [Geotrichum candidum]
MLDNDAIGVREALTTTPKDRCNGDGTATIDDDNIQLRLTTTSKQFNARPIPPKYKVRVMSPLQFLGGYIGAAAPQFSFDQFVNELHMGSVYLEEQPRIDKEQQPQRRPPLPLARPRSTVRFGGTASGALRDRSSVAANDARLATKLTQPYEFEITREAVDAAPTRFAQRLVERMHARAAANGPRRRKAKRQPSGGNGSSNTIAATLQTSGAARTVSRTRSTGHGNVAAMLQSMSVPTQSNSCPPSVAAAKSLDVTSPETEAGSASSGLKPAVICALLESSQEDEPAPQRKRRLGAGPPVHQTTISVPHDNTLVPIRAEKRNSTSAVPAGKTTSTGSMTRYHKIDSFFVTSPTCSFDKAAAPLPPPAPPAGILGSRVANKYEVISIGSSDDDDYNPANPHDSGHHGVGLSGGSSNDDCEIVVGPLQSSAGADPRGKPLAPVTITTSTAAAIIGVIASPLAVILDDTDEDPATKTDVDSDIEIVELG